MRDSNKNFSDWLEILHLLLHSKKSISINEIYRRSKQTRYETVYYMIQKIRLELGRINAFEVHEYIDCFLFSNTKSEHFNNLPHHINLLYTKSQDRKSDKINLVLPEFIHNAVIVKKHEFSKNQKYPYKKILHTDFELTVNRRMKFSKFEKIKPKWQNLVRSNFIKLAKGIYDFTSGLHLQGALNEYCFKYNYRNSKDSKMKIFIQKFIQVNGSKADIQLNP